MKKILKSLTAITLAASLLVPSTAMAATEAEIMKTVTKSPQEKSFFNGNKYTYILTAVQADDVKYGDSTFKAQPKLSGLLYLGETKSTTEASIILSDKVLEGTLKLTVDTDLLNEKDNNGNFKHQPGVYKFTLEEEAVLVDGESETNQFGTKDVFVYVTKEKGNLEPVLVVGNNLGNTDKEKTDLDSENTFKTNKLTVKKLLSGNNANMTDKFEFTITVTPAVLGSKDENITSEDKYYLDGDEFTKNQDGTYSMTKSLGHEETFELAGLSANDAYTVSEDLTGSESGQEYTAEKESINGNLTEYKEETFTNTLTADIPTGVIETVAPFVAMILVAGAFAVVYFKRNRIEA